MCIFKEINKSKQLVTNKTKDKQIQLDSLPLKDFML